MAIFFDGRCACGREVYDFTCITYAAYMSKQNNIGTWQEHMKKEPITNADRIRAMTDEELAAWFFSGDFPWCVYEEDVVPCTYEDIPVHPCERCLLNWLKQEADE